MKPRIETTQNESYAVKSNIIRVSALLSAFFALLALLIVPCYADSLTYCLFYTTSSDVFDSALNLPLEGVETLDCFIIRSEAFGYDWESYNPVTFALQWDGAGTARLVSSDYGLSFSFTPTYTSVEIGIRTFDVDILSNYIGSDFVSSSDRNASWYPANPNPPSYPYVECEVVNLGFDFETERYHIRLKNMVGFSVYDLFKVNGNRTQGIGTYSVPDFYLSADDFFTGANGVPLPDTYFVIVPRPLTGFSQRTFHINGLTPPQQLVPSGNVVIQYLFTVLKTNPVQDVLNWVIPAVGTLVLLAFVIRKI